MFPYGCALRLPPSDHGYKKKYSRWDLNPRPRACEARALDGRIGKPTELRLQEELIFDVGANNFKVVI